MLGSGVAAVQYDYLPQDLLYLPIHELRVQFTGLELAHNVLVPLLAVVFEGCGDIAWVN